MRCTDYKGCCKESPVPGSIDSQQDRLEFDTLSLGNCSKATDKYHPSNLPHLDLVHRHSLSPQTPHEHTEDDNPTQF